MTLRLTIVAQISWRCFLGGIELATTLQRALAELVNRHFPDGLSLEPIQSLNGRHFNNAPPPPRLARSENFDIFSALGQRMRFLAVKTGHSGRFPASDPQEAQTLPWAYRISGHRSCSTNAPCDQRRRDRQPRNPIEDRREQIPRNRHLRQLERHVLRVPRHLGPDLDQLLP